MESKDTIQSQLINGTHVYLIKVFTQYQQCLQVFSVTYVELENIRSHKKISWNKFSTHFQARGRAVGTVGMGSGWAVGTVGTVKDNVQCIFTASIF